MARTVQSYVELQRQHITTQLRQRETDARNAAAAASQTVYNDLAADLALTKDAIAKR